MNANFTLSIGREQGVPRAEPVSWRQERVANFVRAKMFDDVPVHASEPLILIQILSLRKGRSEQVRRRQDERCGFEAAKTSSWKNKQEK